MTGTKLAVALFSLMAFMGGTHVQKSLASMLNNDPRVLYLMAEYNMAVGDTSTALRLLKRASVPERRNESATTPAVQGNNEACPYFGRT
jgi:hypothetical protein